MEEISKIPYDLHVSNALYFGLCHYIGTPIEVTIRREVMDVDEMLYKSVGEYSASIVMNGGSYREGFRFPSSDIDVMFYGKHHKVVTEKTHSSFSHKNNESIMLIQDRDTPPGYVKLKLESPPGDELIASSIVPFNKGNYISTLMWKLAIIRRINGTFSEKITIHGPCTTTSFEQLQNDFAFGFRCSVWSSRFRCIWEKRCILHHWPSSNVLENECHLVAIGSKLSDDENDLEWRLSFSKAERKLVYSMNHTQFLCYGLLKIFFKEVINHNEQEPLLCSYFLKTTLFWLIQTGNINWCPNNLLGSFWACFKYIIHCVWHGVLPNFFIAQNNMFMNKVVGYRQRSLFEQLHRYYEMGCTSCLSKITALRDYIQPLLMIYTFVKGPEVAHIKSVAEIDSCLMREINNFMIPWITLNLCELYLESTIHLSQVSLTEYQRLTIQVINVRFLTTTAYKIYQMSQKFKNRKFYKSDRLICRLLNLACKYGDIYTLLNFAIYYNATYRYKETIKKTEILKSNFLKPYIFYRGINKERYNEAVAGWPLSKRMKEAWIVECSPLHQEAAILDYFFVKSIPEKISTAYRNLSPLVLGEMLSSLSYYKLGNQSSAFKILSSLTELMLSDDGTHVPLPISDTAWRMLAICQQFVGDSQGAKQSDQRSDWQKAFLGLIKAVNIVLNSDCNKQ